MRLVKDFNWPGKEQVNAGSLDSEMKYANSVLAFALNLDFKRGAANAKNLFRVVNLKKWSYEETISYLSEICSLSAPKTNSRDLLAKFFWSYYWASQRILFRTFQTQAKSF